MPSAKVRTRPLRRITVCLFGLLAATLTTPDLASQDTPARSVPAGNLLAKGNAEFAKGNYDEAISFYESEDETSEDTSAERLTRRFNAGVSWTEAGNLETAVERFEEVSVRARGELRDGAFYNSGCANFLRGKAQAQAALEVEDGEDGEERIRKLTEAGQTYHAALTFFRKVDTSGASTLVTEDTPHNIAVTKTALRAVLDAIARLQEEKEREAEEEALKSPAKLLVMLQQKEKLHRSASRALHGVSGARVRLSARRLRKSEVKNRQLAEKLLHSLEIAPGPDEPQPSAEEAGRSAHAATALRAAIEAMKDSEVSYAALKVDDAVSSHTRAVAELRTAREAFPLELPQLLDEATTTQTTVERAIEGLQGDADSGNEDGAGGLGDTLVNALQDKLLKPLAGLLNPEWKALLGAQADEQDDVVWTTGLIAQAQLSQPPAQDPNAQSPFPGAPGPSGAHPLGGAPPPQQPPQLSPEELAALNETLKKEGGVAREAAERVKAELAADQLKPALAAATEVLNALERIRKLLPKPPETTEERLKKLIVQQSAAKEAADGLDALEEKVRNEAASTIEEAQRTDGAEAGAVATELETGQDERAKRAAAKVHEGESEIYASAEALRRGRNSAASNAIERDIKALHEALAILTGQEEQGDDEQQPGQDEQQDQQQSPQDQQQQDQPQKDASAYALSPSDARREQEKIDRERREEEAKIFAGSSNVTVEKDW